MLEFDSGVPFARALVAAFDRMPALRDFGVTAAVPDAAAEALFRPEAPPLTELWVLHGALSPAALRLLAATGWPLEVLELGAVPGAAAGLAALAAAPAFALRHLSLSGCKLDTDPLLGLAAAPWRLEELDLTDSDLSDAAAGPALAAFSRHADLFELNLNRSRMSAAGFKAVAEVAWPGLEFFSASGARAAFAGPHALGAAAFAAAPEPERLVL